MELFYCPELSDASSSVNLSREESHHVRRVFRKKTGEAIELTNGKGLRGTAVIDDTSSQQIFCKIRDVTKVNPSPDRNIRIAISTIRPNRMDWVVEKLTEMAVGSIQPVFCQFTSVKAFKLEHLRKISISAMKQSGQAYLPELLPPLPFKDYVRQLNSPGNQLRLIAHLDENSRSFKQGELNPGTSVLIAIGPEGGFSDDEIALARQYGFEATKLDNHILRTETAAIVAVARAKVYLS